MTKQSQLFLALLCYCILVALPFLEMGRLNYESAPMPECGGNLLVQGACARN